MLFLLLFLSVALGSVTRTLLPCGGRVIKRNSALFANATRIDNARVESQRVPLVVYQVGSDCVCSHRVGQFFFQKFNTVSNRFAVHKKL